jgi:hypothetical protein
MTRKMEKKKKHHRRDKTEKGTPMRKEKKTEF